MQIEFLSYLRDAAGSDCLEVPAATTVGELLRVLGERCGPGLAGKLPSAGNGAAEAAVMVNGRHFSRLGGLDAPLVEGDVVRIFPVVEGG